MTDSRPDLRARRRCLEGRELRAAVADLPGRVLDRLLDLALAGRVDEVEATLRKRRGELRKRWRRAA